MWAMRVLEKSRTFRSKHLTPFALPLQRIGVTANHLTFISLIAGLVSVWFLFTDHVLFVVFGVAHLFFDLFDGVLARATKATHFGAIFDCVVDNGLVVLVFLKMFFIFGSWLSIAAVALYALHVAVYFFSKLRAPMLFVRTITFILLFLGWFSFASLVVAGAAVSGLLLQINYHFTFFRPRR